MVYPYVKDNNLYDRQYYNYARSDEEFFESYRQNRLCILNRHNGKDSADRTQIAGYVRSLPKYSSDGPGENTISLGKVMAELTLKGCDSALADEDLEMAAKIVKTFEVRKRLYHFYNERMKPSDEKDFEDRTLYVLFACMVSLLYRKTSDLKYLNALLKVNDILASLEKDIFKDHVLGQLFLHSLSEEAENIEMLMRMGNK